ncbi:DUF2690 domain-containing protein [Streptomyces sp. AGS-58]|uniref:helix-turn-helix domain-containing protein n=1 Tax=unclassified Streptomyces TaxID=2593676 RepID=UPI0035A2F718
MDPQIREFTERMRGLVDHSGLSVAELADSTGYSRTSWERYLGGRLLAPKGAVVALAETTGTHTVDLTTLWELAERAWTQGESGHDSAMEAIRVARTRAAHADLTPTTDPTTGTGTGDPGTGIGDAAGTGRGGGAAMGGRGGSGTSAGGGLGAAARGGSAPAAEGNAGTGTRDASGAAAGGAPAPGSNSWGLAGYRGPSKATVRPGSGSPPRPAGPTGPSGTAALTLGTAAPAPATPTGTPGTANGTPGAPAGTPGTAVPSWPAPTGAPGASAGTRGTAASTPPTGTPATRNLPGAPARTPAPRGGQPATWPADPARPTSPASAASSVPPKRQQVLMFFAGMAGVLVIIAGVFLLTHLDGDGHRGKGAGLSAPSARTRPSLPPGVKCAGSACTGKDAEAMGCSGDLVTTAKSVTLGTTVLEVRYSRTCGTVWGRITGGAPGDTVRLTVGGVRQSGDITAAGDTIAYTPMAAVRDPARSRACATLASGRSGCTN